MSMKLDKTVGFAFTKIVTRQFAILEEGLNPNTGFGLQTEFKFGVSQPDKMVAVESRFLFDVAEKVFLVLETSSQFNILPEDWDALLDVDNQQIAFPKNFITHLAMLSVGTARGVLHAKVEGTEYSNIVLPTVNLNRAITKDIAFNLDGEM